jgi:transposase-like protein
LLAQSSASIVDHSQVGSVTPLPEQEIDMAGDITFVKCPRGDSFPVRKTDSPSAGHQQIICPKCGHDFDVTMDETVERLSPEPNLAMAKMRTA